MIRNHQGDLKVMMNRGIMSLLIILAETLFIMQNLSACPTIKAQMKTFMLPVILDNKSGRTTQLMDGMRNREYISIYMDGQAGPNFGQKDIIIHK